MKPSAILCDRTSNVRISIANLKFFKCRLVTKQSKLKLYRTVIRPIVTYASETWILKEAIIQKLLVFDRKTLRRIFGRTKKKPNMESQNQ
jgi:hypothetical protein